MKTRPLMQKSIVELERLFFDVQENKTALRQLKTELKHRNVPRAVALLKKVEAVSGASEHVDGTLFATPVPQDIFLLDVEKNTHISKAESGPASRKESIPDLVMDALPYHPPVISAPVISAPVPSSRRQSGVGLIQPCIEVSLTIEQACRTLGVPAGSSWEVIEQARRTLVDRTRPGPVAGLSEEQRQQAQDGASRVNGAYTVLAKARMKLE